MFLEGQIIEFLDADQMRPGYVRRQERDRLQVIDPRGRQVSVNGDRVVIVHRPSPESEFPNVVKSILERIQERRSEVDAELLWQSLGSTTREFLSLELAEIFFSESTPEAASTIFHALSEDGLFFKRNGLRFLPKTADQVAAERTRRMRQREREEYREKLTALVQKLVRGKDVAPEEAGPVIDRIQSWMRNRTGDEVGVILEQIAGPDHARNEAFEILRLAGRIDPSVDRFLAVAGIEEDFSPAVTAAADRLQTFSYSVDRLDFRDLGAMTIDDDDTLEVDDAVTLREEDGGYVVGIHIADLSPFVDEDSLLDTEARKRASTVYLPTVAARMLPPHLSTDLASLRRGVDRPVFTVEMRFDSNCEKVGHRIAMGAVHVVERLSYEDADLRIVGGDSRLTALHRIALRLQQERAARGAITFRRPEIKIHVERDAAGERIRLHRIDPHSPSRVLVSEMMILLNGVVADFAATNKVPILYRTQEAREPLPPESAQLPEALAFDRLRRTFKRSRLSLSPGLHSGLGLSAYTQVSSPIRRYADLVTQRQFIAFLQAKAVPHGSEKLLEVLAAAEAAEVEIRAVEERATTYWMLEYLAREKMGSVMNATILDRKGAMELEDYHLRGKLPDPGSAEPGSIVPVTIERIDPANADIRFKRA